MVEFSPNVQISTLNSLANGNKDGKIIPVDVFDSSQTTDVFVTRLDTLHINDLATIKHAYVSGRRLEQRVFAISFERRSSPVHMHL